MELDVKNVQMVEKIKCPVSIILLGPAHYCVHYSNESNTLLCPHLPYVHSDNFFMSTALVDHAICSAFLKK